jgi:hypothetical protein
MDPFKRPVRLNSDDGRLYTGHDAPKEAFSLGAPETKIFEVSLEKTFDTTQRFEVFSAQTAAHDFGREHIEKEANGLDVRRDYVADGDYVTVYVRDAEGVVTAWVVTAHVEPTYSAVPGAL